jgi:hypothetical protein
MEKVKVLDQPKWHLENFHVHHHEELTVCFWDQLVWID